MKRSERLRLLFSAFVLAALSWYVVARFQVTNDIARFFAAGRDRRLAEVARELTQSDLARTMVLTVEGPDRAAAAGGARALAVELAANPDVAWVTSGQGEHADEAFYDLYFPRRFAFLADRPDELGERLSGAGLRAAARALKRRLAQPAGSLVRPIAAGDPLLAFVTQIERLGAMQLGALTLEDGQLVTQDGRHGVLFLGTRASPFDVAPQEALLGAIDAAFTRVRGASPSVPLQLESSGVNRFAVASQRSVIDDVQRVSTLSMVGVVALFLVAFRSVRYVVLGMIPLAAGTICAMAAGFAIFGTLHGVTLAFGSSLIGTGIDYAEHYFTHHTLAPHPDGPEASLRRIWPGLALGALTTIAGLAGLAWTSFPGVREIAVFSTVGVTVALLSTRWLLPPLTPRNPKPVRLQQRLAAALGRAFAAMTRSRRALLLVPLTGLAICAAGLPRVRWIDDVSALSAVDPALVAEDARVRARIAGADAGRFVLALGDDEEQALTRNDAAALILEDARREGAIDDFRSLHALLRSAALQRRTHAALADDKGLPARLSAAFEAEGFVASAFQPFADALAEPPPPPLTFDALRRSPLGDLVRLFRIDVGGRVGIVSFVSGVRDPKALTARLAGIEDVYYLDQRALLEEAYGRFRERTYQMIGVGVVVVFIIVHARYRRLRPSLAAFLPSVLATAVTASLLALAGVALNLLHLVGALLVLSMGADYGVFVVESRERPEELGATLLSLVVAMFTTVLSFGLLAMSRNPALRALGLVSGIGVLLSVLLAPAALVLFGAVRERR